jgi:hypothetical protein
LITIRKFEIIDTILSIKFLIDIFSSFEAFENDTALHILKYRNLKELFEDMSQQNFTKRPNCEDILKNRYLWSMEKNELKNCYKIIKNLISFQKPHSFLYHMINSKLNSNCENPADSNIETLMKKNQLID